MSNVEFRDLVVRAIEASGRELIDRAQDIVGVHGTLIDLDIRIPVVVDGSLREHPDIDITKSYYENQPHGFDI